MQRKVTSIILASTSRFRQQLLTSTGLAFTSVGPPDREESIVRTSPAELAAARAEAKALDVAKLYPDALVIGADQVLGLDGQSFDKTFDREAARLRLQQFSGKTHTLYSGICLVHVGKTLSAFVDQVEMTMRELSSAEIESYLDTDEWRGCVGCYQYENRGIHLMQRVQGEQSSIVGLPLIPLLLRLRQLGINPLLSPRGPWALN